MKQNITLEIIDKFEDFRNLENIWNTTLEKSGSDYVCLTFEWIKAWWLAFGKENGLWIVLFKKDHEVIGIAPLMRNNGKLRGLPIKEIGFIQNDNSPRSDFIIAENREEVIEKMIEYLMEIKKWDIMNLVNIPEESPNFDILEEALRRKNMLFGIKNGLRSPYIKISSDWPAFFAGRSQKFRKVLRNKINRMNRTGPYSIRKTDNISNVQGVLNNIFEVSKKSWKADYGKDITSTEENIKFFKALAEESNKNGLLNIWTLDINDTPIAYEYHLSYKNRVYALRADYNESYSENSPGSVLDMNIIKNYFESNLAEYDLCGSDNFYKRNWTQDIRHHARFLVFQNNHYGRFLYILEFKVIGFLRALRDNLHKAKELFQEHGLFQFIKRILVKISRFIFQTNSAIWFEKDLAKIDDFSPSLSVKVNLNSKSDTIKWLRSRKESWLIHPKEIETGLKNSHYFPSVRYEGQIVGLAKVGHGDVFIADYDKVLRFAPQKAFIYDSYVLPEYRGKGVAAYLITEVMKMLKEKGFRTVRCHIPAWNKASIMTYKKVGFERLKDIRCFRVLGITFLTADPVK